MINLDNFLSGLLVNLVKFSVTFVIITEQNVQPPEGFKSG